MASTCKKFVSVFETKSCCTVPAPPPLPPPLSPLQPLPPPLQPPLFVDLVDLRDWEDYGINPDASDSPQHAHDVDIVLAAIWRAFPGFNAEKLDTALKGLPLPKPGSKGGISVQEATEVSFTNVLYDHILVTCSLLVNFEI